MKKTVILIVISLLTSLLFSCLLLEVQAVPSLSNGYVTPTSGTTSTQFYYYVTYYDSGGIAPELATVNIDGNGWFMTLYNGIPSNGVYRYSTTLSVGTHNYYFMFTAGSYTLYLPPPSTPYSGPTVSPLQRKLTVSCAHDSPNPPNGEWYFDDGQVVWCSVTSPVTEGSIVWTCTGWKGTGSVLPPSGSGTVVSFTITQDSSITWNWHGEVVTHTLTVNSAHDSPIPSNGPHTYNDGDPVTCSVTSPVTEGDIEYVCTGWSGTGSVPASGTGTSTGVFAIHQDSTITWNWQGLLPDFNVFVDPSQLNIERDSSDTATVHVDSVNNFDEDILLSVTDLPTGITPSFSKNPVHPPPSGQDSSTITFSVDINVPRGTYYPSVVGTSSSKTHDFLIELEITGVEVIPEIINEIDGRITPGDRVEYSISVHNHMQIPIDNVEVTITCYSPTPIGIEVDYASQYTYLHTQDYGSIAAIDTKAKSWKIQVWKTVNTPYYPIEKVPRSHILDEVPIGDFYIEMTLKWIDENGVHEFSENIQIPIEYPRFGPPSGYEHYVQSSEYFHPSDSNMKYAASKAISYFAPAADTADDASSCIYSWVHDYFVLDENPLAFLIYNSRPVDTTILEKMQLGEFCGQCFQSATVTVGILRAIGIPARLVCGRLIGDFDPLEILKPFYAGHFWTEAYVSSKWIHIDSLHLVHDTDEPFDYYVRTCSWCNSVKAAAMKVSDCPELSPYSDPTLLLIFYSSNWEDVSSKYNRDFPKLGTLVGLEDVYQFLGLDIRDSLGRHVKADFDTNMTVVNIPGAYYVIQYNFSFVYLPFNITDFDVVVDARYAEHPVEAYNLTCTIVVNSTVTSEASYQSTINASDTEGYHAQVTNQTIDFTRGIHSITIQDVMPLKTIIGKGYNLPVDLCLRNQGDFPESLNITIYANTTIIAMLINIIVASENTTTIICNLNTTSLIYGNYTITVFVTPSVGEMNITDNTAYCIKEICITIAGDIDGNRIVDIYDVVKITGIYGSKRGDPQFNPNSDLDDDGEIKIYDVVICTSHYRQEW